MPSVPAPRNSAPKAWIGTQNISQGGRARIGALTAAGAAGNGPQSPLPNPQPTPLTRLPWPFLAPLPSRVHTAPTPSTFGFAHGRLTAVLAPPRYPAGTARAPGHQRSTHACHHPSQLAGTSTRATKRRACVTSVAGKRTSRAINVRTCHP